MQRNASKAALAALALKGLCALVALALVLPWPLSAAPGVLFVAGAFYIGKDQALAEWVWVRIPAIGTALALILAVAWFAIWG